MNASKRQYAAVLAPSSLMPSGTGFTVSLGSPLMELTADQVGRCKRDAVYLLIPKRFLMREGGYKASVIPFLQKNFAAMLKVASGNDKAFGEEPGQGAISKTHNHGKTRASRKSPA